MKFKPIFFASLLTSSTLISKDDQWFASFLFSDRLKTYSSRDVSINGSFAGGMINSIPFETNVNADKSLDMQGIRIGKIYTNWRFYAD